MNLKIKSMEIKNFKGIKDAKYQFTDHTKFLGANATGKTTVATAYMWVMNDCDYDLKSNPPIFPLYAEECTPTVAIDFEIDGKPVRICKSQTRKQSKPDVNGVIKESYTNNYTINDVPKSLTDFKAYLVEHEINMDHFLALSHPEVFCSEKKDEQRKVLFGMVENMTDLDVALHTDGVEALAELLQNYTLEEIGAMNKRTMKEIDENYGKKGEILKAKIEGLELARSNADVSEAELGLRSAQEELNDVEYQIRELSKASDDYTNLSKEIMMLKTQQMKLKEGDSKYLDIIDSKRKAVYELREKKNDVESAMRVLSADIERKKGYVNENEEKIKEYRARVDEFNSIKISEKDKVCPTCGREYPAEKLDEIKASFEERRSKAIANYGGKINDASTENYKLLSECRDWADKIDEQTELLIKVNANLQTAEKELEQAIANKPNAEDSDEYKELDRQIADSEVALSQIKTKIDSVATYNEKARTLRSEIEGFKEVIAKADTTHIDAEIERLRKEQINFEQKRADAEKIKYQIETLNASKNFMLEESVNKYFEIVKFKLFERLKNGETKDACIPTIDGKPLDTHCNRGLQTLAKLDIIKGLQNFYNEHYPVFLDNAESLSDDTTGKINMDCQMIMLTVTEHRMLTQA